MRPRLTQKPVAPQTTSEQIVVSADRLFYSRGYANTSFADIAQEVGVSRGNFYYHFKTKDEILDAVVDLRLERARELVAGWEREKANAVERIGCFVEMWLANGRDLARYGCPVGSLCVELQKLQHPSGTHAARLFTLFRTWLRTQFELLGRTADADALAMELLVRSQGVAVIAQALGGERFIESEVERMRDWLTHVAKPTSARRKPRRPTKGATS